MFFKTQIDKKYRILENNLPNHGRTKKIMHDNYATVVQISLYNETKNHFYYDSIEYMC